MNHLETYLQAAPISLSLERAIEGRWLSALPLADPLLDLGCGDGLFAERTFPKPLAVGIDRDPREIQNARARRSYRALAAADSAALPFRDGCFATVISNSVLEHLADLPGTLAEVRRVLHRGGRFWFSVPSQRYGEMLFTSVLLRGVGLAALSRRYEELINVRLQRNLHCLDIEEWRRLLETAGLRLVRHQSYLPRAVMFANDLGYPLAVPAMVWRRLLGRWTLSPRLRKPVAALLARALEPVYDRACPEGQGGGWLVEAAPSDS